jgi:tRNA threonylcarbamoyladenosine biosynthesis protein TsaE
MTPKSRLLADDAATAAFGAELALTLQPGDLLLLVGDLGAGKTTLARAVIRALLAEPSLDVPSPSFSLVQPYQGPRGQVLHADLYRLASAAEIDELGLFDDASAIVVIEWPERAPELLSRASVIVELTVPPGGVGRELRLQRPAG